MNEVKFIPHKDGDDVAYFGTILIDDGSGRCYVRTPYFKDKSEAHDYTRRLTKANYQYSTDSYFNITYHVGEWKVTYNNK